MDEPVYTFYGVCAPGLESITAAELDHLGLTAQSSLNAKNLDEEIGGVEFHGFLPEMYRANLHLRTASRVLVRLGDFFAAAFPELRRKANRLSWEEFLLPGKPVALRVTCHRSRLYHQKAVAERIAGAIADRMGQPPSLITLDEDAGATPAQMVLVRLKKDHCTISVDSSGALLHRRGYRLATAKAPLRETLAAAMLLASGWDAQAPLLDPFCGSGTIPIEGALLAKKIPPGRNRAFAFMNWPNFDKGTWKALLRDADNIPGPALPRIIASDRDPGAIEAAKANAERAGVADCIEFSRRALSAIDPPPSPGWVITNPPHGTRLSKHQDLRNLYAQMGKVLHVRCAGWRIAVLCPRAHHLGNTGLDFDEGIPLMNGGLKVKLFMGKV